MAQTMNVSSINNAISMDRTDRKVDVKGWIAKVLDILFVEHRSSHDVYTSEISDHLKKDIGLYR